MPPKAEIKHTAVDATKLKEKEAAAKVKAKEKEAAAKAKAKEKEAAMKAKEKEAAAKAKTKEKEAAMKAKEKEAAAKAKEKEAAAKAKAVAKPKANPELTKAVKDLDNLHQKKTESAAALAEAKKLVRASTVERNQIEKQTKKLASDEKKLKAKIGHLKN